MRPPLDPLLYKNLTFHLQTEKDIKFGHVVKLGVESGVYFGVEFGVIFGVDFKFNIALIIYITIQNRHKKGVMNQK